MTAEDIIKKLNLKPLEGEGGYFSETWRSPHLLSGAGLPAGLNGDHHMGTCIYYLITPETFSEIHKLPTPEIWHFYLGDPAEQLQILPNGEVKKIVMGQNLDNDQQLQVIVPADAWQGTRLADGGKFALFATTMSPGFEYTDYMPGDKEALENAFPEHKNLIRKYFHH